MPNARWRLSAESITAASAVVAALIALAVGVWENVRERRHDRLSVIPHLEIIAELRTTEHPDSVDRTTILVVNEGVGPAIVDDVKIRVRDAAGTERIYDGWDAAREALESWGVEVGSRARLGEGIMLGVGREYTLVTLRVPEQPREGAVRLADRLLDHLGIVIEYHSIYGDEYRSTFGEEE